jgi:nuclear cap-binding protein subunit 1
MEYWKDQPGIGVNIVDKLLNYTILSPWSVIEWAVGKEGGRLSEAHVFEMVSATVGKVTGRVRQVVRATKVPGLLEEQKALVEATAKRERESGSKDQMVESGDMADGDAMVKQWGERWLRVFRRKFAVEEAWAGEVEKEVAPIVAGNGEVKMTDGLDEGIE